MIKMILNYQTILGAAKPHKIEQEQDYLLLEAIDSSLLYRAAIEGGLA